MEIIKVKCPKGKKIEIEKGITTLVNCPQECNLFKLNRCSRKNFNYTEILSNLVKVDFSLVNNSSKNDESKEVKETSSQTKKANDIPYEDPFASAGNDIPYEDPFASVGDDIPYEDPFAGINNEIVEENIDTNENNSLINKYNKKYGEKSIFDDVIIPSPDEPCFEDGIYTFYERYTANSSGGVKDAIRYLFLHWYTSYVFNYDEESLTEQFLVLLKMSGFTKDEDKIKSIIQNRDYDLNQKFFHLFYDVIYKGQMTSFYWCDEESPFVKILPKFKDRQDFINKLSKNPLFFKTLENCLDEVILYFNKTKESFLEDITIELSKTTGKICFFTETEGKTKLNLLGNVSQFIDELSVINSKEKMYLKCELFKKFTFTMNGSLILRKDKFEISRPKKMEDDSIYQELGIMHYGSSNCATIYNYYISLVKEHINIFHLKRVNIGNAIYSLDNLYFELIEILQEACKNLTYRGKVSLSSRYYLTKSLIERGVLDYYIEQCETTRLREIINFYLLDEPSIKDYLSIKNINHIFNTDKGEYDIQKYISLCLEKDKTLMDFDGDVIIQNYFAVNVDENSVNRDIKKLDTFIKKNEKLISKFSKVGEKK